MSDLRLQVVRSQICGAYPALLYVFPSTCRMMTRPYLSCPTSVRADTTFANSWRVPVSSVSGHSDLQGIYKTILLSEIKTKESDLFNCVLAFWPEIKYSCRRQYFSLIRSNKWILKVLGHSLQSGKHSSSRLKWNNAIILLLNLSFKQEDFLKFSLYKFL